MEDDKLVPNDSAAATASDGDAAQRQREIDKLRSERAHLQSDLDAADAQVAMLRGTVEELQLSKSALESRIEELEGKLSSLASERAEEARLAESERRALDAVAARAAELEGDVTRLQHDLVAAISDGEGAVAEATRLNEIAERLQGELTGLQAKFLLAKKAEDGLKLSIEQLVGEKDALENKERRAEAKIAELEGKVESVDREAGRVLEEKENELGNMKLAIAELEEKVGVYEARLEKVRELENGNRSGIGGGAEQTVDMGHEAVGARLPWKMIVASTGAVAAVAAVTCYLHHVKSRSA